MIKRNKLIVGLTALTLAITLAGEFPRTIYASGNNDYSYTLDNLQGDQDGEASKAQDSYGRTWNYYQRKDGTISLWGTPDVAEDMVIPSELNGYKVSGIAKLVQEVGRGSLDFGKRSKVPKKVEVSEGITEIESLALNCPNLNDVTLPSTIRVLGAYSLNDNWKNAHTDSNGLCIINGILVDGHKASGDVIIPSDIKCIGAYSFDGNENITSAIIPESVIKIGEGAFLRCGSLKKVEIKEGTEIIGREAFAECSNLGDVKIPSTVKAMGTGAFDKPKVIDRDSIDTSTYNSDGLVISNGVLISGKSAKGNIEIPDTVTEIQDYAFYNNPNIINVKLPSSVTKMGEIAFAGSSIESINIPGSLKEIPHCAFEHCTSLKDVKIEDGVESIGNIAFSMCFSLEEINIPNSVTKIESSAFRGCSKLAKVNASDDVLVGKDAFDGTKIDGSTIGKPLVDNNTGKEEDKTKVDDTTFNSDGLVIENGVLIRARDAKGNIEIPDTVTEIKETAFSSNNNIAKVKIPASVKKIGPAAFAISSITSVNIPGSIKDISTSAFEGCKSLENVTIESGVESIGKNSFMACTKISKIDIPSSVKTIGECAFFGCENLETVNAGENVNIQDKAFEGTKTNGVIGKITETTTNNTNNNASANENKEEVKTGWVKENGIWYYNNEDGSHKTGWFFDNYYGCWYYLNADGSMKTGWFYDSYYGSWYYLNADGSMKTGWHYDSYYGKWYYLYGNGSMAHNAYIGKYYVNSSGAWV